jgi:hypothetical protein
MTVSDIDPRLFDLAALAAANINPQTGFATDYLNHFNEIVMMLEMVPELPDMLDDVMTWEPRSYAEHFASSSFHERDLAVAAYRAAPTDLRAALDETADILSNMLLSARAALALPIDAGTRAGLCAEVVHEMKPVLACAGGIINGQFVPPAEDADDDLRQATVDALLETEAA